MPNESGTTLSDGRNSVDDDLPRQSSYGRLCLTFRQLY